MADNILNGNTTSKQIKEEIKVWVDQLISQGRKTPHLAAVLVGSDGASMTYVNAKVKDCAQVGFQSSLIELPETISQEELLQKVDELNRQEDLDGFIVQLPLPKHIDEQKVIEAIDPNKDVDGFHPASVGKMLLNLDTFIPATPYGIIELLDRYQIETSGKHCVVIGRSHIVGSPVSVLMARNANPGNATVTLTHSRTQNLKEIAKTADILIVALGKAEFVTADMVKEGAVVIDVGITRVDDSSKKSGFRLLGDVNFNEVGPKASYITPVPGGVGPMTRAMLLKNTVRAYKVRNQMMD